MEISIKERSNNFSIEEINKLAKLLEKYSIITLNKKTDHASLKQKEEAWCLLTNEFNSDNAIHRPKKQLMYKFNNMKKQAKKESLEKKDGHYSCQLPSKPSETNEWLHFNVSGVSTLGLPQTDYSGFTRETDNTDKTQENAMASYIDDGSLETSFNVNQDNNLNNELENMAAIDVKQEPETFDSASPKSMSNEPVEPFIEPDTKKRKFFCTPTETRKKIATRVHLQNKSIRDQKLLEFALEEHKQNMRHKEELHEMDVDFKRRMNELLLQKTLLEIEFQKEKLKRLKFENVNLLFNKV